MKDEEKLHEHGNHEIVFANAVVLTEGKDDECAVRMGFEKLNVDCDAESISIVACGGVDSLPDYARVCSVLGIPWVAIHDRDLQPDGKQKSNTARSSDALKALASAKDALLMWDNSLESALNCLAGKATPRWILDTYGQADWTTCKSNPVLRAYCNVIEEAKASTLPIA
jgi:predicted ATP-dependent endonuclease of OLD family